MGTGEVATLRKKLSGKEKLDLLAEDLVQRAILSPFRLEQCLNIASSQCDAYLDDITNLKDPTLFCDLIKTELDARCPLESQQRLDAFQNPTHIASIIATRIHNVYMIATGWRLVRDTLADFEASGLTDKNIKVKLKDNPQFRLRYLVLYDMVGTLINIGQANFSVLAMTTPHYARYFKKVESSAPDGPDIRFDWNGLRDACLSFVDSIIIELCFPRAPYPKDILFSVLRDAVQEAPREARRFPQALWDAVGDFSTSVELYSLLEVALLGPDGHAWKDTPRSMPEEYEKWVDAQLYSDKASDVFGNWKDLIYPLEKTKEQSVLDEMWRQINLNYKSVSGKEIDLLWGLSGAGTVPQWHPFYILYEPDSDDDEVMENRKALVLTKKRLASVEEDSDDSTPSSMPSLQTVSGSSEASEDGDSDDSVNSSSDEYADDGSGYDTGEEEELYDMSRAAMDIAHEADFCDTADLNIDFNPLSQRDDYLDNPFIKLLGSLKGRLFSSNPKLKVGERSEPRRPGAVGEDNGQKVTLEEIEEDEVTQVQKKKKKKKSKKKNASTAILPDQVQASSSVTSVKQDSPRAVSSTQAKLHAQLPTPGAMSSAAPKKVAPPKVMPLKVTPIQPSTASLSVPVEPMVAQSARSYIKSEQLDVQKNKVKSRSDQASIFSNDTKNEKKGIFSKFRPGRVKDVSEEEQKRARQSWFSRLSKRATKCMHQLLRTSQDMKQGLAPMKWDHFVALMVQMGFTYEPGTAGSSVRFIPPDKRDRPITIHKRWLTFIFLQQ
ncbi:hypothetical protein AX15_006499 [Amanita polypyramis BW_CC]|nr:hypothetical protein AX15_006499 [Amanita polypyramis BW_CC]